MTDYRLCTCGLKLSRQKMRKHIITSHDGHLDVEWLLGHLIIRDDPNDEQRRQELRQMLIVSGLRKERES